MHLGLKDKKVAVIGAAKGIGQAIAQGFAAEGAQVFGFDREAGPGVTQGDVTRYDDLQAFAAEVGPLDHMVFCVGVGSGKFGFPFWNLEPSDWAKVLEINLIGAVNAAHAVVPGMITRGSGSILFLVSVAGQMGSQTDPPYSAAKAGLINFTQCAAKDLAAHQIRVNALSPGMVRTQLNHNVWVASQAKLPEAQRQTYDDWADGKIRKVSPLGRWQELPEFAAMATFLASDHAKNITGQTLNIDGGHIMHS